MSIETMKQALDWMEWFAGDDHSIRPKSKALDIAQALRQAIEQAEKQCQCPACKIKPHASDCSVHNEPAWPNGPCDCEAVEQAQKQEPVAWMFQHEETGRMNYVSNDGMNTPEFFLKMNPRYVFVCALYISPPQRQPLTDEEIDDIWGGSTIPILRQEYINLARAIEAAHGIKGEA